MRGTLQCRVASEGESGIIPAYAGNTGVIDLTGQRFEDHPRVCGEHMMECMSIVVILGSSPRMRGTRVHDFGLCHNAGIIPAYAGNTRRLMCRVSPR